MEIEVGEYVRTNKGYITKMTSEVFIKILIEGKSVFGKPLKHNKNIIKLLEKYDFINRECILDITGEYIRTNVSCHNLYWLDKNLYSIVTHEMFESIEYKVEEE